MATSVDLFSKSGKILITGGAGFIGTNLVEYLLENSSSSIIIIDNLYSGNRQYIDYVIHKTGNFDRVKFIIGDIRNMDMVEEASKGVNGIVHLAALPGVFTSLKEPREAYDVNVSGTLNLLEACRKFEIEHFIFASSNAAVGDHDPPINENNVAIPVSPYGAYKLAGEAFCSAYYQSYGIKAVSLRFANAYGPYSFHKTSVIPTFIQNAKQGKPLVIYGDGAQTRDFIHVHDMCKAIFLALQYDPERIKEKGLFFQIASSVEVKILDLANLIVNLTIKDNLPTPVINFHEIRKGEVRKVYVEIKKAKALLGFNPSIPLDAGLQKTWENWNHHLQTSRQ